MKREHPPGPRTVVRPLSGQQVLSTSRESLLLRVAWLALALLGSVLISRGLGPTGRGEYYLPVLAATTLIAFCKLGLDEANIYLFGSRHIPISKLSRQNGTISLLAGGVGVTLLVFARELLPSLFFDVPPLALVLAASTIPFALHAQLSAGLLTLKGWVTWQFRAALFGGLLQVMLLSALFFSPWFSVRTVLVVQLAAVLVTWAMTAAPLDRGHGSWIGWDPGLLRESLSRSLLLHVGIILWFFHLRLDVFMLKALTNSTAVGIYSLSVTLAETVKLGADSLALAILPSQTGVSLRESAEIGLRGVRISLLLSGLLAIGWLVLGYPLILFLFGDEFASAYPALVLLLPGMVLLGVQRMCSAAVLRTGMAARNAMLYGAAFIANAGLNLLLIPRLGAAGAALASSLSYSFGALLFLIWQMNLAAAPGIKSALPGRDDVVVIVGGIRESIRWLLRVRGH